MVQRLDLRLCLLGWALVHIADRGGGSPVQAAWLDFRFELGFEAVPVGVGVGAHC